MIHYNINLTLLFDIILQQQQKLWKMIDLHFPKFPTFCFIVQIFETETSVFAVLVALHAHRSPVFVLRWILPFKTTLYWIFILHPQAIAREPLINSVNYDKNLWGFYYSVH